jgi:hypothetical protein
MKFISSVAGKQRAAAQWFYPTHGAAIVAGVTWLTFSCPGCGQFGSVDLRTLDRHRCGSISSLIASVANTFSDHQIVGRPTAEHEQPVAIRLMAVDNLMARSVATRLSIFTQRCIKIRTSPLRSAWMPAAG